MIYRGDTLTVLKTMPSNHYHCAVTSPPYYGLRDYGTGQWIGGAANCDHKQSTARHDGGRVNTDGFHGSDSLRSLEEEGDGSPLMPHNFSTNA